MSVIGLPAATPAGSTHCITVKGANGAFAATGEGSVTVVSITQSSSRPVEWTVCFSVGTGGGTLHLTAGGAGRHLGLRGQ